jgi:hypothetical protein
MCSLCYNFSVFKTKCVFALPIAFLLASAFAQEVPAPNPPSQPDSKPTNQNPPVKVNIINVCTPAEAEIKEIKDALKKIPAKAGFSPDFEVTRGRASAPGADPARYIRLRRELSSDAVFNIVQYSLSSDPKETQEVLVLKAKDPKDLLLVSIEDNISASAASPATALETDTPASHIKVERFGKSAIALARCENADQSRYENVFTEASKVMAAYRKSLGLRSMFRNELTWLSGTPSKTPTKEKTPKSVADKGEKSPPSAAAIPNPKH